MKRMLFNATQAEELRVAIVDGQKLVDLDIESAAKEQRKGNIYKAVITRIEPSLEAAFVDYGAERHGFLPFKEVSRAFFKQGVDAGKARIQDALQAGQEIIVQVEKDERGNKGAALTTFISLAGRYLVLMPNNPRGGGVSRRVEGEDRQELRDVMDQLDVPNGMSLIARTAGIGRSKEELEWDMNYLMQLWRAIEGAAKSQSGAFLIYLESSLVIRAIRDYFHAEIGEILIDTDDIFEQAQHFMATVMPDNVNRIKRYRDDVPLFSRFQIEHQIESAYSRQVNLPSGGAIVIDHTEALVSIDVNSGRATRGSDIEETALRTNCEAADEIARQLRLRDLGGLIVIDFIDMESQKNQREVENRLRDALHFDRARVQTGKISRFGLLELSRQRLRPALAETSYITCPRCTGTGHIRSTESAALHILRILEEESMKENTGAIHCQVPVDVGTFLLNEKRVDIARIELRHRINLIIVPNRHLETPAHEIVRLRHDQLNQEGTTLPSYQMAEKPAEEGYQPISAHTEPKPQRVEAAVKGITPDQPAPMATPKPAKAEPEQPGIIAKIFAWFKGNKQEAEPVAAKKTQKPGRRERGDRQERGERGRGRGRGKEGREEREERQARPEREDKAARGERKDRSEPRAEQPRPRRDETVEGQPARRQRGDRQEKQDRPERGERLERAERQPKAPRPEAQLAQGDASANPATTESTAPAEGQATEGRRRGRRGGRGRGERARNGETANAGVVEAGSDQQVAAVEAATAAATAPAAPRPMPWPTPVALAPEAEAVKPASAPVVEATVPAIQQPTPSEALPIVVEAAPMPAAPATPAPVQPAEDLAENLQQAGLVMIETAASKAAAPVVAAEPPIQLGRKPKPVAVVAAEPLQMVETKRD
jgi:ribonuclease E